MQQVEKSKLRAHQHCYEKDNIRNDSSFSVISYKPRSFALYGLHLPVELSVVTCSNEGPEAFCK